MASTIDPIKMSEDVVPPGQFCVSISIILIGVLTLLLFFVYRRFLGDKKNYPPGPPGLPLFGSVFSLFFTKKQQHEIINEWSHKYGPILTFKIFNTRVYILSDARLAQEAFQGPDITDRISMAAGDEVHGRKNNGIVLAQGNVWKQHRRFFVSIFKKVDAGFINFEEIIRSEAEQFLAEMEKRNGESFDPCLPVNLAVANIITKIVTGVTYEYDDAEFRHLMECSLRLFELIGPAGLLGTIPILAKIPTSGKTELIKRGKEVIAFIEKAIETHRVDFDPDETPTDFIGRYLKEMADQSAENKDTPFDYLNLRVSCQDTLLGSWDSTTSILSWAFYTLASHPNVQRRIRQEISDVVGDNLLPFNSDRHSMPFTEAAIVECMRLTPVAAFHLPHIASCDCTIGGFDVPKGSAVITNLWHLSLSPNIWDKPHEFRPDRFLDEKGMFNRKIEPIRFGVGRRVCPGEQLARMEVFTFITFVLQRFTLSLPEGAPRTNPGIHGLNIRPSPFKIHAVRVE